MDDTAVVDIERMLKICLDLEEAIAAMSALLKLRGYCIESFGTANVPSVNEMNDLHNKLITLLNNIK